MHKRLGNSIDRGESPVSDRSQGKLFGSMGAAKANENIRSRAPLQYSYAPKQMHRPVVKFTLRQLVRVLFKLRKQARVVFLTDGLREATCARLRMDDNVSTKDMLQKGEGRKARSEEALG